MNDHKELVDKLRFYADTADDHIYGICINSPKVMLFAAEAIEQLVKERDAAVNCIPKACAYCKHFEVTHNGETFDYNCRNEKCTNISGVNTGWEWRGVREDNDEAD